MSAPSTPLGASAIILISRLPNRPVPFKTYTGLKTIALPQGFEHSTMAALAAVSANTGNGDEAAADRIPTLAELARILHFAGGITRRRKYAGGEILFRAAACTGALYEIELYVVCADLEELPAGVYHWSPKDSSLRRLRDGDHRGILSKATAGSRRLCRRRLRSFAPPLTGETPGSINLVRIAIFGWDNGNYSPIYLPSRRLTGYGRRWYRGLPIGP